MHLYFKKVIFSVHISQQPHIGFMCCKKQNEDEIVIFILVDRKMSYTILFFMIITFLKKNSFDSQIIMQKNFFNFFAID